MSEYTRIQGDTGPPIRDQLQTDDEPDDLTGADVVFTMWDTGTETLVVDENSSNVTVTNRSNGDVEYEFQAGDLDETGVYAYEWEVTFADGTIVTYRRKSGAPKEIRVFEEGS